MFRDDVLEMYFYKISEMKIPIKASTECLAIMEMVIEEIRRGEPYAELSRLFYGE